MNTKRLRILHVEDDPFQVELMRTILQASLKEPYDLVHEASLASALRRLKSDAFNVVLLDLGLPDSRGLATFTEVMECAPQCAIIVFTGTDDQEIAMRALQGGAQDYLVKGEVDRHVLVRAIHYASERKRGEMALAAERDLLQSLLESLPDQIYVKDEAGRFIRANSAVAKFFGLPDEEALQGKTDFDFFPHGLAQQFFDEEQRIIKSGQTLVNREAHITGHNGTARWELTTKAPFRDHRGKIVGTVGINRDVTMIKKAEDDLKRANSELEHNRAELQKALSELQKAHTDLRSVQVELIEVEKLRTIGRLAAGIAHEVKNPLAIMLRGINYLSRAVGVKDPVVDTVLKDMNDAIRRADGVIHGLLDFASPREIEAKEEDINPVIEESLSFVRHDIEERRITVEKKLAAGLPRCRFDRQKIEEVFINVFENAVHAMPGGGTLGVRSFSKIVTGFGENIGASNIDRFKMGDCVVVIEITDTGPGIPSDMLGKVFDPFFTTKPTGQGTGLGLSVSKTIMDLHGGAIEISNCEAGGASVVITIKAGGH